MPDFTDHLYALLLPYKIGNYLKCTKQIFDSNLMLLHAYWYVCIRRAFRNDYVKQINNLQNIIISNWNKNFMANKKYS